VETRTPHIHSVRLSTKVTSVTRKPSDPLDPSSLPIIIITDSKGRHEEFDHVIFSTHADQTLQILVIKLPMTKSVFWEIFILIKIA